MANRRLKFHFASFIFIGLVNFSGMLCQKSSKSPTIEIFKLSRSVEQRRNNINPWATVTTFGSRTLVLEEGFKGELKITCRAEYPVRLTHEGASNFEFLNTQTSSKSSSGPEGSISIYSQTVYLDRLEDLYTANYICDSKRFPERVSSFYLYVPGTDVFVNTRGGNIYVKKSDTQVILPCVVSNPDALVFLQKSNANSTEFERVLGTKYDPKVGFILSKSGTSSRSLEGKYYCVTTRRSRDPISIGFNLIPDSGTGKKCSRKCVENSACRLEDDGDEYCKCAQSFKSPDPDPLFFTCQRGCKSDLDCPSSMLCQDKDKGSLLDNDYEDDFLEGFGLTSRRDFKRVCRNPCLYPDTESIVSDNCTGKNRCVVLNHLAVCL